jgi:hypothetical protein
VFNLKIQTEILFENLQSSCLAAEMQISNTSLSNQENTTWKIDACRWIVGFPKLNAIDFPHLYSCQVANQCFDLRIDKHGHRVIHICIIHMYGVIHTYV